MSHETTAVRALYLFDAPAPKHQCDRLIGYLSQIHPSGVELLAYSETREVFCVIDTNNDRHYLYSDDKQRYLRRWHGRQRIERRYVYPDYHVGFCDHANVPALPQVVIDLIEEQSTSASPSTISN